MAAVSKDEAVRSDRCLRAASSLSEPASPGLSEAKSGITMPAHDFSEEKPEASNYFVAIYTSQSPFSGKASMEHGTGTMERETFSGA
jgi:hypothetical protein